MDRLGLQQMLETALGSNRVYFQPPASYGMSYPAIRYERDQIRNTSADNDIYRQTFHYTITVIDANPDSQIVLAVSRIPKIRHVRQYKADNLNHDVFELYY